MNINLPKQTNLPIILGSALVILLLLSLGIYFKINNFLNSSPTSQENASMLTIEIPKGASLTKVTQLLNDNNIITDPLAFKVLAMHKEVDRKLQAGSLAFSTAWTPFEVIEELVYGKSVDMKVTIPEGLPWWEVARLLSDNGFVNYQYFKDIIHDPNFLADWDIPFNNAEGFLYPDTYFFPKPGEHTIASTRLVVDELVRTFWLKTSSLWEGLQKDATLPDKETLNRYLTLASIVEKETGVAEERAKVAGVYTNRLNIRMKLQADPTIIYGLGEDFVLPIYRSHINDAKNKYNTYQHYGLPPGPICSPSLHALNATLNPEKHDYLYFVAKSTKEKSHNFSKSLAEHNAFVQEYRKTENRR